MRFWLQLMKNLGRNFSVIKLLAQEAWGARDEALCLLLHFVYSDQGAASHKYPYAGS